ncbi:MAG: hypothetical protein U0518_01575 [Candidatus Gracilibacteria bacterium]
MQFLEIFRQFRRKSQMQVVLRTLISSMTQMPDTEKLLYLEAVMVLEVDDLTDLYDKISQIIAEGEQQKESLIFDISTHV